METTSQPVHLELGATMAAYRGAPAAASYGDEQAEYEALTRGFAVAGRSWVDGLELTGEDRLRFLGSQATCELKDLASGQGVFGFFVSAKGRVEAEVTVLGFADRLWLELPPGLGTAIGERLEKYKVIDRVEISALGRLPLTLAGPHSSAALESMWGELPGAELGHRSVEVAGVEARLVRESALGEVPVWSLWLPAEQLEGALRALLASSRPPVPVGWRAWERLRLEAGRPAFGLDFGPDCFPQETGLGERGVSYTKGCYLGQEVVARIHYRGGVQRRMCRLRLDAAAGHGDALLLGGKKVGEVGSAGRAGEEFIGLAVVHNKAEDGARLELETGGDATWAEVESL